MYHGKVNLTYSQEYKACELIRKSTQSNSPKVIKEIILGYLEDYKDYFIQSLDEHHVLEYYSVPGLTQYKGRFIGRIYSFKLYSDSFSSDILLQYGNEDEEIKVEIDINDLKSRFLQGIELLKNEIINTSEKLPTRLDPDDIKKTDVNKLLNSANNIQRLKLIVTEESKNHLVVYWNGIETCIQKAGFKSEVIPHRDGKYIREVTEKEFPKVKSGIISAIYKELD